jgi:anti-sigma factor RsiW
MNDHAEIHDLLTLAVAGALDADEQRRVEDHVRRCDDCRVQFEAWQRLTGVLEALPTPQAPLGLVERTYRLLLHQAAMRAQHRRSRALLVWLTVFSWAVTLLTWLGFRWLGDRVAHALDVSSTSLTMAWIVYTLVAWLGTAVIASLLGKRYQQEGRIQ